MNKIILIGRVTKNIELKVTPSGTEVADFSLAVTRNFKNAEGEYEADFINCIVYGKLASTISSYVRKGDRLAVEGRLQVRSYTNSEGKNVYVTEVVVNNIDFLEPKKKDDTPSGSIKAEEIDNIQVPNDPFEEQMTIEEDNIELPF